MSEIPTHLPPGVTPGRSVPHHVFHKLPRLPGWTYETHDGVLRVQPDGSVQVVRIRVDHAGVPARSTRGGAPHRVVSWRAVDRAALLRLADMVFSGSVHYWGWPDADRRESLAEALRAGCDVGSVAAVDDEGIPSGLLLTARGAAGPFIHVLGVAPPYRRQGIARTMLAEALGDVRAAGIEWLHSSYLVACARSALWHYALGFEDVYTPAATASRLRAVRWELARTPGVPDDLLSAAYASLQSAGVAMGSDEDPLALVLPA